MSRIDILEDQVAKLIEEQKKLKLMLANACTTKTLTELRMLLQSEIKDIEASNAYLLQEVNDLKAQLRSLTLK